MGDAEQCETHPDRAGFARAAGQQLPKARNGIFHRTFCHADHCSAASKSNKSFPTYHCTYRYPFSNAERYTHSAADTHTHFDSHTPYRNGDAHLYVHPAASDIYTDPDITTAYCDPSPDGYALPIPGHPDAKRLPVRACRPCPARSIASLPQLPESAGLHRRSRL